MISGGPRRTAARMVSSKAAEGAMARRKVRRGGAGCVLTDYQRVLGKLLEEALLAVALHVEIQGVDGDKPGDEGQES